MFNYICVTCGGSFQHHKKNKKFCSIPCMYQHRAVQRQEHSAWRTETRTCALCSKNFTPTYRPQRYCSRLCVMKVRGQEKTKLGTFTTNCGWCQKEITKSISQRGKSLGDFCSQLCSRAFKRGHENKYITRICPKCDKEFQALYARQARYCSKSCATSGSSNPMFGKPGPMLGKIPWTRGLTKEADNRLMEMGKRISQTHKEQFKSGERNSFGENNPNHNNTRVNKERSQEALQNYSHGAALRIIKYKDMGGFKECQKGWHHGKKLGKEVYYKSSYELRMLKLLDLDPAVAYYEYEPLSIKYDNDKRRYVPDFIVYYNDKPNALVEVKGWINDREQFEAKCSAARAYCEKRNMEFKLYFIKEIIEYEKAVGQTQ